MRQLVSLAVLGSALAASSPGCAPQRSILITSHPPGATVYIDGEKRGQTDSRFALTFHPKLTKTVRIEKEGFQPWGQVLHLGDHEELYVVLQEAPSSREIQRALKRLEGQLEVLPSRTAEGLRSDGHRGEDRP